MRITVRFDARPVNQNETRCQLTPLKAGPTAKLNDRTAEDSNTGAERAPAKWTPSRISPAWEYPLLRVRPVIGDGWHFGNILFALRWNIGKEMGEQWGYSTLRHKQHRLNCASNSEKFRAMAVALESLLLKAA
ncbi:hypothetical protein AVEN_235756-1 [Araneus ventricosus]|uniref:Uncharacterized protein n=1 Tax=Araneus ventricosus TaxID=182803 RepID=A0A4Y2RL85_ARAVE|nr:hypothetical protein AVEN_235756-1 [Araneus ventricosus]